MAKLIFTKQTRKNYWLRFLAGLILFVWIGNTAPPLAALAADNSCQLSCCQGLARHPAGSCADGACHLKAKKRLQPPEIICGAKEFATKQFTAKKKSKNPFDAKHLQGVPIFDAGEPSTNKRNATNLPSLQTAFSEQSCQIICSACVSHNFSQQNQRADDKNIALVAFADKPRPPNATDIEFLTSVTAKLTQIILCDTPARAPPTSFL